MRYNPGGLWIPDSTPWIPDSALWILDSKANERSNSGLTHMGRLDCLHVYYISLG